MENEPETSDSNGAGAGAALPVIPSENQGLLVPLPSVENLKNLNEIVCTRTAYKAEELSLAANSHSVIGNLLTGLALLLTAEIGIFSFFSFSDKKCEDGEVLKVVTGVATTFTILCLLFSYFTYWQLEQIDVMLSRLQGRQRLLLSSTGDETESMDSGPAADEETKKNADVVKNLCDSISDPIRVHKLLQLYKVLICILFIFAISISIFMGYKSYDMKCGKDRLISDDGEMLYVGKAGP